MPKTELPDPPLPPPSSLTRCNPQSNWNWIWVAYKREQGRKLLGFGKCDFEAHDLLQCCIFKKLSGHISPQCSWPFFSIPQFPKFCPFATQNSIFKHLLLQSQLSVIHWSTQIAIKALTGYALFCPPDNNHVFGQVQRSIIMHEDETTAAIKKTSPSDS